MAYVQDPNDPNLQQGAGGAPGAPGVQPPQTSGGTSGNATVGGTPQGAAAVPNTSKAPPVQDLKAYLEANAPQSVQMGQKIAGNLDQTAQKVTGDVNAGQQTVDQTVQASHVTPNADLVTAAAANPADFVSSPDNVTAFTKQRDASYAGPSTFESTPESSALTAEVTDAMSKAPDITSTPGVQQLVAGQETNPTLGMENLDTLLLQGNPEAMAPIKASIPGVQNLGKYLSGVGTTENAAIQKAIADNAAAKAGVQTAFTGPNGAVPKFQTDLSGRLTSQQAASKAAADKVIADIAAGGSATPNPQLTPDDLTALGISPAEAEAIFSSMTDLSRDYKKPVDLTPDITQLSPQAVFSNPNTIATADDYAREAALEKLLGNGSYGLDSTLAGNAGKTSPNLLKFDKTGARAATSGALRQNDLDFLSKIPNNTGTNIMTVLQQSSPQAIQQIRSQLPTDQQGLFDNVLSRLGIGVAPPPPPPPTTGNGVFHAL